jgi:hypothetical protein
MGESGLTGGCQCGAVRYRVEAFQEGANLCHCRMCQKASGGPFMAFAPVAHADFILTQGTLSLFRSSEIAERGFCAACGTPLTYLGRDSDHISVTIGSLDDPAAVAPTGQLASEAAVPWLWTALAADNTPLETWLKASNIDDVRSRQYPDQDISGDPHD